MLVTMTERQKFEIKEERELALLEKYEALAANETTIRKRERAQFIVNEIRAGLEMLRREEDRRLARFSHRPILGDVLRPEE